MTRTESDRGAILVHAAFALLALMAFSGFAVDYGTLWVSRTQAQNAADSGALAGALARVYDDASNPPASKTSGKVYEVASNAVGWNRVWGQSSPMTLDWTCPDDGSTNCVVVNVFRDGTNGSSTLPTFFLSLAGINSQKTMAYAVAKVESANEYAGCLRPWFMIDAYTDANSDGVYDAGDTYTAPGYQLPRDLGDVVTFHNNLSPSGYGQVDVGQGKGGSQLKDSIEGCADTGNTITDGSVINTVPGGKVGPESQGVQQLVDWDSSAYWDTTTMTVKGSCAVTASCTCGGGAAGCPNGTSVSPRVVITPVCSPTEANCAAGGQSNGTITVTNILAFFITGPATGNGNNLDIPAVLIGTGGGEYSNTAPAGTGSFVKLVGLIR